eukprot:14812915-Heterocapsa_arctica.AAC.1
MSNKEPVGCDCHNNDAEYDPEPADDGAGIRKIYVRTSRPVGVPTAAWESISLADRQDLIRLDEIHKGKGNGAGTRNDTGGLTGT